MFLNLIKIYKYWILYLYILILDKILSKKKIKIILNNNFLEVKIIYYNLFNVLTILKYHSLTKFNTLLDIVVYNLFSKKYQFIITYLLKSMRFNSRVNLTTFLKDTTLPASVTLIYPNAEWLEREVWDFFGINFLNNLDLRRLLNDYGFKGHPLLKNFPLVGYLDIIYSEKYYMLTYNKVELTQEYKNFVSNNSW